VAHAYNPSYKGSRDWEDHSLGSVWTKVSQDPISTNGWVWWYTTVTPARWGSTNKRIVVQASHDIKQDSTSKITNAKRAKVMAQVVEHLSSKLETKFYTAKEILNRHSRPEKYNV
jgi:hypothetical protein